MMKNRHIEGSVDGFSVIVEIVVKAPGEGMKLDLSHLTKWAVFVKHGI